MEQGVFASSRTHDQWPMHENDPNSSTKENTNEHR